MPVRWIENDDLPAGVSASLKSCLAFSGSPPFLYHSVFSSFEHLGRVRADPSYSASSSLLWPVGFQCRWPAILQRRYHHKARPPASRLPVRCVPAADRLSEGHEEAPVVHSPPALPSQSGRSHRRRRWRSLQRYIQSGGCSFLMFVAIYIDHVLTSDRSSRPHFSSGPTPITPSVEEVRLFRTRSPNRRRMWM